MKEIEDIVRAYDESRKANVQAALATVVHVEGSSYRRPGARMLVTDEGKLTGAISGGCLEGDALRKALLAISEGKNKLVTYDTTDEDDAKFGVQLGCNGIVHILFEPVDTANENNPVELLKKILQHRRDAVVTTLFSLGGGATGQPGTCLLYTGDKLLHVGAFLNTEKLYETVTADMYAAIENKTSSIKSYNRTQPLSAFIDVIRPPVSLVIFGAGNDVIPLVDTACILGWQTTVIDGRSSHANVQRFPKAYRVLVAKPEAALHNVLIDQRTVFVLMTHNYNYDVAILAQLLPKQLSYIGVLGPRQKLQRMLDELNEQNIPVTAAMLETLFGPVGLDIGAETAEEIAISVIAEIKAVMEGKNGSSLRHKLSAIHSGKMA